MLPELTTIGEQTAFKYNALFPNEALLDETHVLAGIEHPVWQDSRFACLQSKLREGRKVTIAVIGGSISAGSVYGVARGQKADWLYHSKVSRALNVMFPAHGAQGSGSGHLLHNGALPATGPAWFEHCVESQLPFGSGGSLLADLIVIEFAVNTDGQPAAYERLLRKVLTMRQRHSLPAILVLNLHVWNRADVRTGNLQPRTCLRTPRPESARPQKKKTPPHTTCLPTSNFPGGGSGGSRPGTIHSTGEVASSGAVLRQ